MKTITEVNIEVGKAIQEGLQKKDLTQHELAKSVGSTQRSISSYVTGKTQPPLDMLTNICRTLEINLNQILHLPEYHYPNRVISTNEELEYMNILDEIQSNKRREFIKVVKNIKDLQK